MELNKYCTGENILASISKMSQVTVCMTDTDINFATLESKTQRKRYNINGNPHDWHDEVSSLTFMPYPGFFYNFKDRNRTSYNFNGTDNQADDLIAYDITSEGAALCLHGNTAEHYRTYIGNTQTPHNLYNQLTLTQDNKGFIYQAVGNYDEEEFYIVEKNQVIYTGYVDRIRISDGRTKYSWVGTEETYAYPYLDSKRVNHPIDSYEFGTFVVSDDCTRYLLCERKDFNKPAVLIVDGKRTGIQCDDFFEDSCGIFSGDNASYCFTCLRNGKAILVRDDKVVACYDDIFDTAFIGNDIYYIGCDNKQNNCTLFLNGAQLDSWPYIEQYSSYVTDDGKHYCFCANEYGLESDKSRWQFVVDGKAVWTFDALPNRDCGYFFSSIYLVQFSDDSFYLAAIKDSNLVLYRHAL